MVLCDGCERKQMRTESRGRRRGIGKTSQRSADAGGIHMRGNEPWAETSNVRSWPSLNWLHFESNLGTLWDSGSQ